MPASPLLSLSYDLVSDSSGTTPAQGSTITLFFEPNGKAGVTAQNATLMLSHHGTWSYFGTNLTLAFTASDFHPSATFSLDLTATTVTMPFQVFSTSAGSSTWTQVPLDLSSGAYLAGYAVASDPVVPCVTVSQVVAEAAEYAAGVTGITPQSDGTAPWPPVTPTIPNVGFCVTSGGGGAEGGVDDAGDDAAGEDAGDEGGTGDGGMGQVIVPKREMGMFRGAGSAPGKLPRVFHPLRGGSPYPQPSTIVVSVGGLTFQYTTHPGTGAPLSETDLLFYSFLAPDTPAAYSLAPLASDPRTDLVPESPDNGAADPPNKTALLVSPLAKQVFTSWNESQYYQELMKGNVIYSPADGILGTRGFAGYVSTPLPDLNQIETDLEARGYTVTQLDNTPGDTPATPLELTKALLGSMPGVIEIFTHGSPNGGLLTPVELGSDPDTIATQQAALMSEMQAVYPDFPASAIGVVPPPHEGAASNFAMLTPSYWTWLRSKGADFSHSLVYVGACSTDATPTLQQAIQARAYFAYGVDITFSLVDAVAQYIPDLMSRPTTSAEEAYYNMFRIGTTHEFVFTQDKDFSGSDLPSQVDPTKVTPLTNFSGVLHGWGWNGSAEVPYLGSGWLSAASSSGPSLSDGQVWYLLWAARWGQDSVGGADNLVSCYNSYWSQQNLGGLANPFCQNANDGNVPTQDEVAYATYLLTGEPLIGFSGTLVPRFTLDDGQ